MTSIFGGRLIFKEPSRVGRPIIELIVGQQAFFETTPALHKGITDILKQGYIGAISRPLSQTFVREVGKIEHIARPLTVGFLSVGEIDAFGTQLLGNQLY